MGKSHGLYRIDVVRTIIITICDDDIIHPTVKKYEFIKINHCIFFNNTKWFSTKISIYVNYEWKMYLNTCVRLWDFYGSWTMIIIIIPMI